MCILLSALCVCIDYCSCSCPLNSRIATCCFFSSSLSFSLSFWFWFWCAVSFLPSFFLYSLVFLFASTISVSGCMHATNIHTYIRLIDAVQCNMMMMMMMSLQAASPFISKIYYITIPYITYTMMCNILSIFTHKRLLLLHILLRLVVIRLFTHHLLRLSRLKLSSILHNPSNQRGTGHC